MVDEREAVVYELLLANKVPPDWASYHRTIVPFAPGTAERVTDPVPQREPEVNVVTSTGLEL